MEISAVEQILSYAIVGAALSTVIQWAQAKYGVEGNTTKFIAIGASVVLGGGVWFLAGTTLWVSILGILAAANTMYALVFSGVRKEE